MQKREPLIVEEEEKPYNIKHRCFHFSKEVIKFISNTKYEWVYKSMFDQLLRSATSIGANVVEGGAGSSKREFINFLNIALKSANETKYWLCLIRDTLDVDKIAIDHLLKEANAISKIVGAIVVRAKQQ
jgi:four helix bundle protein